MAPDATGGLSDGTWIRGCQSATLPQGRDCPVMDVAAHVTHARDSNNPSPSFSKQPWAQGPAEPHSPLRDCLSAERIILFDKASGAGIRSRAFLHAGGWPLTKFGPSNS